MMYIMHKLYIKCTISFNRLGPHNHRSLVLNRITSRVNSTCYT